MMIEFTQSRNYGIIGLKQSGEVADVDDDIAKQFIELGFAKRHAATPHVKTKDKDKED